MANRVQRRKNRPSYWDGQSRLAAKSKIYAMLIASAINEKHGRDKCYRYREDANIRLFPTMEEFRLRHTRSVHPPTAKDRGQCDASSRLVALRTNLSGHLDMLISRLCVNEIRVKHRRAVPHSLRGVETAGV